MIVRDGVADNYASIWRYALSLTGKRDHADDLAQAACLKAIENHWQFVPDTKIKNWLFRIAHNLWISELRRQKVRTGNGLVGIETAEIHDPRLDLYSQIENAELMAAVLGLPEAQRATSILVYAQGFSYSEAAEILDIPIGTVMSRLAAARKALALRLNGSKDKRDAS
ncbi:MAG: RNA polymerase sigma factor [Pseudomonadota bacterium]